MRYAVDRADGDAGPKTTVRDRPLVARSLLLSKVRASLALLLATRGDPGWGRGKGVSGGTVGGTLPSRQVGIRVWGGARA